MVPKKRHEQAKKNRYPCTTNIAFSNDSLKTDSEQELQLLHQDTLLDSIYEPTLANGKSFAFRNS